MRGYYKTNGKHLWKTNKNYWKTILPEERNEKINSNTHIQNISQEKLIIIKESGSYWLKADRVFQRNTLKQNTLNTLRPILEFTRLGKKKKKRSSHLFKHNIRLAAFIIWDCKTIIIKSSGFEIVPQKFSIQPTSYPEKKLKLLKHKL